MSDVGTNDILYSPVPTSPAELRELDEDKQRKDDRWRETVSGKASRRFAAEQHESPSCAQFSDDNVEDKGGKGRLLHLGGKQFGRLLTKEWSLQQQSAAELFKKGPHAVLRSDISKKQGEKHKKRKKQAQKEPRPSRPPEEVVAADSPEQQQQMPPPLPLPLTLTSSWVRYSGMSFVPIGQRPDGPKSWFLCVLINDALQLVGFPIESVPRPDLPSVWPIAVTYAPRNDDSIALPWPDLTWDRLVMLASKSIELLASEQGIDKGELLQWALKPPQMDNRAEWHWSAKFQEDVVRGIERLDKETHYTPKERNLTLGINEGYVEAVATKLAELAMKPPSAEQQAIAQEQSPEQPVEQSCDDSMGDAAPGDDDDFLEAFEPMETCVDPQDDVAQTAAQPAAATPPAAAPSTAAPTPVWAVAVTPSSSTRAAALPAATPVTVRAVIKNTPSSSTKAASKNTCICGIVGFTNCIYRSCLDRRRGSPFFGKNHKDEQEKMEVMLKKQSSPTHAFAFATVCEN